MSGVLTESELKLEIRKAILHVCPDADLPTKLPSSLSIPDDLGLDSLDVEEVTMVLEENLGKALESRPGVETVQDLMDLVPHEKEES